MAFGNQAVSTQRVSGSGGNNYDDASTRIDYTGYEKDSESGLEYAQARYYNPTHGRYTSVDPMIASATIKNPQTFNRYSYVLNSPYKFTDPLGLLAEGHRDSSGGCGAEFSGCSDSYVSFISQTPVPESHSNDINDTSAAIHETAHVVEQPQAHESAPPPSSHPVEASIYIFATPVGIDTIDFPKDDGNKNIIMQPVLRTIWKLDLGLVPIDGLPAPAFSKLFFHGSNPDDAADEKGQVLVYVNDGSTDNYIVPWSATVTVGGSTAKVMFNLKYEGTQLSVSDVSPERLTFERSDLDHGQDPANLPKSVNTRWNCGFTNRYKVNPVLSKTAKEAQKFLK